MKTRLRHIPKEEKVLDGLPPMLKWAFIVVLFYSVFGAILADNYPGLFLAGLFLIFPAFTIAWLIIKGIVTSDIFKKYLGEITFFLASCLSLYIYSIAPTPSFFGLTFSLFGILSAIIYFRHIREDRDVRVKKAILKARAKDHFKILLKNKNFLNHHNYFNNLEKEALYKKYLLKTSILSSIVTMGVLSMLFFLIGLQESFKASLGISGIIFTIGSTILTGKSLLTHYTQTIWKPVKIYQKYMPTDYFVKIKNKIFTY